MLFPCLAAKDLDEVRHLGGSIRSHAMLRGSWVVVTLVVGKKVNVVVNGECGMNNGE